MNGATASLRDHEAYLHALDRALRVGLVASLVVHAALAGLLPSPFHHDHPLPRTLEVDLVEVPQPPLAVKLTEPPPVEPPAPAPVTRPAPPKPEPARSPKPVREHVVAAMAPTVRETDRLLTHAEPEKAVTSVPIPPADAETKEEKVAAPAAKAESGDAGPVAPPSFRAGYLRNPEPPYPTASRRLGEQGTVRLRVLVSAEGHAVRVEVQRTSGYPRLDEAAAAAVREWRFVPAKRGTTPVEATVIVPIVFRLEAEQ